MGDHGRFVETQERVSKNMERRSGALADGGSHPNHGLSGLWTSVLVSRRGLAGYRIMVKVVDIGGILASARTRLAGVCQFTLLLLLGKGFGSSNATSSADSLRINALLKKCSWSGKRNWQ